ncbi:MAG: ankyrin repeat domain-containing protein [Chlamydiota bacterium]
MSGSVCLYYTKNTLWREPVDDLILTARGMKDFDSKNLGLLQTKLRKCFSVVHGEEKTAFLKDTIEKIEKIIQEKWGSESQSFLSRLIYQKSPLAEKVVSLGVSTINSLDERGEPPLFLAIGEGDLSLIRNLIENGAEVNQLYDRGVFGQFDKISPLGKVIELAFLSAPDFERAAQRNPGPTGPGQASCLSICGKELGHPPYRSGETPSLQEGVLQNWNLIFQLLLASGAKPLGHSKQMTPLTTCIDKGLDAWTEKLLHAGADPNGSGILGIRPIHKACLRGNEKILLRLIDQGANIHALMQESLFSMRRLSPLHLAVLKNQLKLVEILIQKGGNPHQRAGHASYDRQSPLDKGQEPFSAYAMSVEKGFVGCMEVILRLAPPSSKDLDISDIERDDSGVFASSPKLSLRMKIEAAKRQCEVPNLPSYLRCYTNNREDVSEISSLFERLISGDFGGATFFCQPIVQAFIDHISKSKFSFYFLKEGDLGPIQGGGYNSVSGNEITLACNPKYAISMVVHEITHKLADIFYPNSRCAPPPESEFQKAYQLDLKRLAQMELTTERESFIKCSFIDLKAHYTQDQLPGEYLARIPELMVALARSFKLSHREIEEIMNFYLPNLFKFYKEEFLPLCLRNMKFDPE